MFKSIKMSALVLCVFPLIWSVYVVGQVCRTIQARENVTDSDEVYRRLDGYGYQQCVRECSRSTECGDIRFTKNQLGCILLRKSTGPYSDILYDQHILSSLGACSSVYCSTYKRCVSLTDGTSFCAKLVPWCPTYINDRCYTLREDQLNWTQAKADCENRGQTLATIDSQTTFWMVVNMLRDTVVKRVYTGGYSNDENSPWTWIENGNEINFNIVPSWVDRGIEWRCLFLHSGESELRALRCSVTQSYLCQSSL